jgi:hypothetical protein
VSRAEQLVAERILAGADDPRRAVLQVGEDDRAPFRADDLQQRLEHLRRRLVDPHVDLAAARKPDAEGHVIRDPERQQPRLPTAENLPRDAVDLVLDATARDRPRELPALRHGELRADRPRRRAPGRDHRRERDALSCGPPALDIGQYLTHRRIVALPIGLTPWERPAR